MLFWDASALVKAYSAELGTSSVLGALAKRDRGSLTDLVALEVFTVLGKRFRSRKLTRHEYSKALREFSVDYPASFYVFDVPQSVRQKAFDLAHAYRDSGLSAMDLLHLATATEAARTHRPTPMVFATSDAALQAAADAEGLRTFNPETDPLAKLLRLLSR